LLSILTRLIASVGGVGLSDPSLRNLSFGTGFTHFSVIRVTEASFLIVSLNGLGLGLESPFRRYRFCWGKKVHVPDVRLSTLFRYIPHRDNYKMSVI
jgi:hypothetical protein